MTKRRLPLLFALSSSLLCSCESKDLENWQAKKPNGQAASGKELSAGIPTIFSNALDACDTQVNWATGELETRFNRGDGLYDDVRGVENVDGGGLGPPYAGYSCGSCHKSTGRTHPAVTGGGPGPGFSSMLIYISCKSGGYPQDYGRVLHDQVICGTKLEGRVRITTTSQKYALPGGEEYELATPHYEIKEWYADSIPTSDLQISARQPLRHVGMGQMMALDLDMLKQIVAKSNYPEYDISGRMNYVTEKGKKQIGISGNKTNHADLTVGLGLFSDLGVTNDRFPHEVGEGQGNIMSFAMTGAQVSTEDMEDVDLYLQTLGIPAHRNVDDPAALQGEQLPYQVKCHLCHVASLKTCPRRSVLLNNMELPRLGNQVIHPYSGFLLHDMGVELGDDYPSGLANGNEWRITLLWGLGLQEVVNGHTYYLHDGHVRNLTEVVMWHGGGGVVSRTLLFRMTRDKQAALIRFL